MKFCGFLEIEEKPEKIKKTHISILY